MVRVEDEGDMSLRNICSHIQHIQDYVASQPRIPQSSSQWKRHMSLISRGLHISATNIGGTGVFQVV
jgi:hypothetical protein